MGSKSAGPYTFTKVDLAELRIELDKMTMDGHVLEAEKLRRLVDAQEFDGRLREAAEQAVRDLRRLCNYGAFVDADDVQAVVDDLRGAL